MQKLFILLCIFLFVACAKTSVTTDEGDFFQNKIMSRSVNLSSFEYPAIQWSAFDTHEQKVAACEIPDSILPNIPTEELVEICMEYPLLFDAYAFDSPLEGIKKVVSQFNGFKELMDRTDNCSCLFRYLKNNDVRNVNFTLLTNVEEGTFLLRYSFCEYLLAFDNILNNSTEELKEEISSFVYEILENKELDRQHYALSGLSSSVYLWASILSNNRRQTRATNTTIDKFLEQGIILNIEEYLKIKQACQTYN